MTADSRALEILVAKIQAQLAPTATVTHNAKLRGRNSGVDRQIDVLVRQRIGQYEMLVVLDAKDYAVPVDVKCVEEFHGLIQDVGAHKRVLVSPLGFSRAAKTRAAGLQIDLYSPVDTDPHKWTARVAAPCICDFRSAAISIKISGSAPMPLMIPGDFHIRSPVFDKDGKVLGISFDMASVKWNEGKFPTEPGEHYKLPIFDVATFIDNGYGQQYPIELTAAILVQRQLFFGQMPISKLSGFKDELSGAIITNAFTTGIFDINEVEKTWLPIATENDAPARPLLILRGLVGWDPIGAN